LDKYVALEYSFFAKVSEGDQKNAADACRILNRAWDEKMDLVYDTCGVHLPLLNLLKTFIDNWYGRALDHMIYGPGPEGGRKRRSSTRSNVTDPATDEGEVIA
jgi:hypothetical protein